MLYLYTYIEASVGGWGEGVMAECYIARRGVGQKALHSGGWVKKQFFPLRFFLNDPKSGQGIV